MNAESWVATICAAVGSYSGCRDGGVGGTRSSGSNNVLTELSCSDSRLGGRGSIRRAATGVGTGRYGGRGKRKAPGFRGLFQSGRREWIRTIDPFHVKEVL